MLGKMAVKHFLMEQEFITDETNFTDLSERNF